MDLTKTYPRSVRDTFAGVVQIGRTTDKARAHAAGTVGEYHYNCGMDKAVFEFLGITDHEAYAQKATQLGDAELEKWLRDTYVSKKSQSEIDRWNREWLAKGPEAGSDSHKYFLELRSQVAPSRTDVTSWPDLLDLDERRDVPMKAAA
jgi:hypothetical protein